MDTLQQAIQKVAASYTSAGSISNATKNSFAERGLDCDERGVYLKDVKPRVRAEKERQVKVQRERKARRSYTDRLDRPASYLRRTLFRTLGLSRHVDVKRDFSSQDKNARYIVPAPSEPFGLLIVDPVEKVDKDWDYYASSYSYPKVTVEERYVRLCRVDIWTGGLEEISRTDEYVESGFRGDWLLSSAARLLSGRLPQGVSVSPRWQKERGSSLRRVQLHERARVEKVRSIGNVRVYRRTLAGILIDYCAVTVNERGTVQETFHAEDGPAAVRGLREKLIKDEQRERAEAEGQLITRKMLRKDLGFCDAGIESAASALGVSAYEPITADRLAERVWDVGLRNLSQYTSELKTLAEHLGREDLIERARA